ncbi:N-6 DNA methylase [Alicyclobacillus fastidiosus]|uniref:N-6 DNA methylase n=1 Tax=Alicyclobacillus fastidiosus TaxID=392011 RepID=UPI0023E94A1B|nr:N-6 DNA methylase [Alicyclobacillus fastidiosus]GMA65749.1 hypothetical protein GCM10025859_61890 [Alicyclobacillus fastidiosus]GMA65923.1 hypothetical protein GCM10025859_63640 [Alicyclobacillus fastidiosus]
MTNLYTNLNNMRQGWANEEELRIGWLKALSSSLGIELQAERKKLDSSYNNVIIEFKAPKLFHGRTNSPAFKEAIHERLKPYIMRKSTEDGLEPEAYIGIAIDGDHICFARIVENDIVHGELLAFSEASVQMVATALTDSFRRAITVSNLVEDFGLSSDSGIKLMQAMANALSTSIGQQANNKIKMLFAEWQTLFGQVADLSVSQLDGIRRSIRFTFSNNMPQELIIPASLFVIHTYNSLIIKLLAAEIVSAHNLTSRRVFAESIVTLPDNRMFAEISEQIEKGKLFEAAGIKGFVEEAIFGWYLDACSYTTEQQNILSGIRDTLIKLSFYRTESLADARTQDILKGFYQSLVPEDLRKSLGEFYTPDWLVEFTLNKLQAPRWLTDRFLDPTCGSGSFLLAVVKRLRLQAQQAGLSPRETLDIISDHVWGFDLNPLAVQTSRVNMLMAVADLLKACGGKQIEFPVLLADAVYSPAPNPTDPNEIVTYSIGSQVANLQVKIPSALVLDRDRLDKIFVIMGEQVEQNQPFETAFDRIYRALIITDEEKNQWEEPLRDTYDRILELHKKNWNGIWFRIVRNFFGLRQQGHLMQL